jgi:6-phosphofructokinase 2
MPRIVTLTVNPTIDGASETETVRPTRKMRTSNETYEPGGGGINVARVLRELGGDAFALYLAGGVTGPILEELLKQMGIASRRLAIRGATRISHTVFERSTGREFRFVPEGPDVSENEWRQALGALADMSFDYLVASGSLCRGVPQDFYVHAAQIAHDKNAQVILDTSGDALRQSVEAGGIYVVKPSLGELETLAGQKLPEPGQQEEAALRIVRSGKVEAMAVTLGHRGAFLAQADGVVRLDAINAEVRSAVGAGDSFVAGMTYGLAEGRSMLEAFRLGIAAGTAAVLTPGTQMARRHDVERFYAQLSGV